MAGLLNECNGRVHLRVSHLESLVVFCHFKEEKVIFAEVWSACFEDLCLSFCWSFNLLKHCCLELFSFWGVRTQPVLIIPYGNLEIWQAAIKPVGEEVDGLKKMQVSQRSS